MLNIINLLLLSYFCGGVASFNKSLIYIPKLPLSADEDGDSLDKDRRYCFKFTWLGEKYDNSTFFKVQNKTCSDYKTEHLCIDPMAVTFRGGKPSTQYILQKYTKEATCKLSEDQVCAKYTVYYNGIASHVVRFCTRINVESESPMRSGCLTEKAGPFAYEICACESRRGAGGICNSTSTQILNVSVMLILLIFTLVLF